MKKILLFLMFLCSTYLAAQVEPVPPPDNIEEDNTVRSITELEVKPEFPGGFDEFRKFIAANFKAPDEPGLKGNILVSFIIEMDGTVSDIKVLKDIGYGTLEEARRVVRLSPRWTPGIINGKKVRVLYSIPIHIQTSE